MKIVSKYETEDGKMFDTREAARGHEVDLETLNNLQKLLHTSIQTGRIDSVLRHLLVESSAIAAILSTHRKKLPKVKSEAQAA